MSSCLLLNSSLVLRLGFISLINSASIVNKCSSPLIPEPTTSRSSNSGVRLQHLKKCILTGPSFLPFCFLKQVITCRSSSPDIARITSWTRNFINHSTSQFSLDRRFKARQCCFQFSECDHWLYWCSTLKKMVDKVICYCTTILHVKLHFGLRLFWLLVGS